MEKHANNPVTFVMNGGTITKRRLREIDWHPTPPWKMTEDCRGETIITHDYAPLNANVWAVVEFPPI